MDECNHIICYSEIKDGAYLVYEGSNVLESPDRYFLIRFKFCPLCGKELKQTEERIKEHG
jgi:hypothetical protein